MLDILSYVIENFQLYYEFNRADISYGIACNSKVNIIRSPESSFFSERNDIDPERVIWKDWNGESIPFLFEKVDRDLYTIENGRATIHFDIIAASFYFLSGWNEIVTEERDKYGRMPYDASMIKKLGIVNLPVVNYYFNLLATVLTEVSTVSKKNLWGDHSFACFLSHDIDKTRSGWKEGIVYSLKNKKFLNIPVILLRRIFGRDEFFNFDTILSVEESFEAKSTFFFLRRVEDSGQISNADYKFSNEKDASIRREIEDRGHEVGIHGSYESHIDQEVFIADIKALSDHKIVGNRFHYLQFDPVRTVHILEESGIQYDSSLGFAEDIGFRRGICTPFFLFDFLNMKANSVLEIPLTCMDVTLQGDHYLGLSPEESFDYLVSVIQEIQKFEGVFTLLWHNNYFADRVHPGWSELYSKILSFCKESSGKVLLGSEISKVLRSSD